LQITSKHGKKNTVAVTGESHSSAVCALYTRICSAYADQPPTSATKLDVYPWSGNPWKTGRAHHRATGMPVAPDMTRTT